MQRGLFILLSLLVFAGCAGPRVATEKPTPEGVSIREVEDFDSEAYPARVAPPRIEIRHEVPEDLLTGKADLKAAPEELKQVDGYRIQIFSSTDREAAEKARREAIAWWEIRKHDPEAPVDIVGEELPAYIVFIPPFYRVRIGDFTSRADAEVVLDYFREKFRDAWIVPDKVYIR